MKTDRTVKWTDHVLPPRRVPERYLMVKRDQMTRSETRSLCGPPPHRPPPAREAVFPLGPPSPAPDGHGAPGPCCGRAAHPDLLSGVCAPTGSAAMCRVHADKCRLVTAARGRPLVPPAAASPPPPGLGVRTRVPAPRPPSECDARSQCLDAEGAAGHPDPVSRLPPSPPASTRSPLSPAVPTAAHPGDSSEAGPPGPRSPRATREPSWRGPRPTGGSSRDFRFLLPLFLPS